MEDRIKYCCRPSFRYAEMNELVEIVRDTGDVWLCRGKGEIFPCHKDWLKDEPEVIEIVKEVKPQLELFL